MKQIYRTGGTMILAAGVFYSMASAFSDSYKIGQNRPIELKNCMAYEMLLQDVQASSIQVEMSLNHTQEVADRHRVLSRETNLELRLDKPRQALDDEIKKLTDKTREVCGSKIVQEQRAVNQIQQEANGDKLYNRLAALGIGALALIALNYTIKR